MARQRRLMLPGLLYHVIARGNRRQPTFLTERDYNEYLSRLGAYQQRFDVALFAYCLMPNHVHLLLQTSDTPLAKFMQGLQQSYTQRFNLMHDKVGHVFQGRYKAIVCERDEYLTTLVRYIHLNPVRAGLVSDAARYPYSSHGAYLTAGPMPARAPVCVETEPVLSILGGRAAYRRFVRAGASDGHDERYYRVHAQQVLGAPAFAQRIRHHPAQSVGIPPLRGLDVVLDELADAVGVDVAMLRSRDRSHRVAAARAMVYFMLVRRLGFGVGEVATALGRDAAVISVTVGRLAARLGSDERIAATVARVVRDV
jgi:putative transposase